MAFILNDLNWPGNYGFGPATGYVHVHTGLCAGYILHKSDNILCLTGMIRSSDTSVQWYFCLIICTIQQKCAWKSVKRCLTGIRHVYFCLICVWQSNKTIRHCLSSSDGPKKTTVSLLLFKLSDWLKVRHIESMIIRQTRTVRHIIVSDYQIHGVWLCIR